MQFYKKAIAALASVVMIGSVAACGQSVSDQQAGGTGSDAVDATMAAANEVSGTNITFWHSMGGVNGEAINTLVKKFNDENKLGIKVTAQYQGDYDDSLNKLKSAQIGNMGADLVQIYDIGTRFMVDSGWIVPMQELVNADNYDLSKIEPNLAAYYTVNDKLYSMPFNSSTPLMYYNKDMFAKAGITEIPDSLEGIEKIADQLVKQGGAGEAMSLSNYGWFFEQFLGKQGLNFVNNGNGRKSAATAVEFDSNGGGKKILETWKRLSDEGFAPNVGKGGDAGLPDFSSGKSAITFGSTASLKQVLQDVNGKFEVGTAYFPKISSSDKGGVSIGGASLWALQNKDPKKLRATWEFIKFMISPESQAYWNSQTGYFPVTVAAQDEQVFKDNIAKYPQFQTAIDQLHASSKESVGALLSVFPQARQTVQGEIENLLGGKEDVDTAVKNMADKINKSITDYAEVNQ